MKWAGTGAGALKGVRGEVGAALSKGRSLLAKRFTWRLQMAVEVGPGSSLSTQQRC